MFQAPIHVISLARTPGRLDRFRADNPDLDPWRVFTAIDGAEVDVATRNALGDTALWSRGGVGAALSQIALWRLCVESQAPLTICEDDAVLRSDFHRASSALLAGVPDFDIVLWGWNFDAVVETEVTPGVPMAMIADQTKLRLEVEAFQTSRAEPILLKLRKALGTLCYTVSPKGAAFLLSQAAFIRPIRLSLPLMPTEIGNVTPDVTLCGLYDKMSAHLAVPPLAISRNEGSWSTVRLPDSDSPTDALAQVQNLEASGRDDEALERLQSATRTSPDRPELWSRLGQLLSQKGLMAAATAALQQGLCLEPQKPEAHYNLARVYMLQARWLEALDHLDQAVISAPKFGLAHSNRGVALLALGRAIEAETAFRAALEREPDLAAAHQGLAVAAEAAKIQNRLQSLISASDLAERNGQFENSRRWAQDAIDLEPRSPLAWNNLGVAYLRLGRPLEAETAFRAAIDWSPGFAGAHHGLAFALLKQGRWLEAWPEYEWRLRLPQNESWTRRFERPLWAGDLQPDATLLLAAEQGLGDTLQAVSLISEIRSRVGRVVVAAPAGLGRLLQRMASIDLVLDESGPRPEHDVWLPLMSLPGLLMLGPDRRAPPTPSFTAEPGLRAAWSQRLPNADIRIGVAWQGNPDARVEYGRSFPLAALSGLAAVPGVVLISLQKDYGCEQLVRRPLGLEGVIDLGEAFQSGDFEDTAAIIDQLDLVVACDTAVAHLAGSLGRPVWIALGHNPDWRWSGTSACAAWYDSATLFHRNFEESWNQLFERMAISLKEWHKFDGPIPEGER